MYAVDSLRQLADKLLRRAELAGFTSQGEALRPLTSVLRCSDSASVRELAVACIAYAVDAHGSRIGSGWRAVAEALAVAASDPSPAVVTQAMDAMAIVFAALYEPEGHACSAECVGGAMAAVGNPAPAVADLTSTALYLFQTIARRLTEASSFTESKNSQHDLNKNAAHSALKGGGQMGRRSVLVAVPTPDHDPAGLRDAWLTILGPLAAVARADPRPLLADTAVAVLFQILQANSARFSAQLWSDIFTLVIAPLLTLPIALAPSASEQQLDTTPQPHSLRTTAQVNAHAQAERTTAPLARLMVASAGAPLRRRPTFAAGAPLTLPMPSATITSNEGTARVVRHGTSHFPDLWALLSSQQPALQDNNRTKVDDSSSSSAATATAALLAPSLCVLRSYIESEDDAAASLGSEQLQELLAQAGSGLGRAGWQEVERTLCDMVMLPSYNTIMREGSGTTIYSGSKEPPQWQCRCQCQWW